MHRQKSWHKKSNGTTNHEVPMIVIDSPESTLTSQIPFVDDVDQGLDDDENVTEPLVEQSEDRAAKKLRRNSVSLPSGLNNLELESLRQKYKDKEEKISEVGFSNNASEAEDDTDIEANREPVRIPLRKTRRKSVINQDMLKPHDDDFLDTPGSTSPGNSITSINSLASLLKEKMQALPAAIRKKKPDKEYKIKAFVGILFLVIVFLVGFAYVLYHQQVLHRAYFEKIKFSRGKRVMRIYSSEGTEIIRGRLGTTINYDKVFPCLEEDVKDDGSICLEWMRRARLYLNFKQMHDDVRCYNVHWMSLSSDVAPTDCFDWSPGNGHWYGGGQTADGQWPLEKGKHHLSAFITGNVNKQTWGNVLKRYFINSKGAAIIIDDNVPLYTALEENDMGKSFCLQARHDNFAYVNHITPLPHLNYSICTSSNMTRLHSVMSEKNLWDGLKQADMDIVYSLLSEPVWEITTTTRDELSEGTVYNYTEDVIALGLKLGHVLLNEFWQNQIGDYTLDLERFPTLAEIVDVLHRRGFRVVLAIQPFVSTESVNFAECVRSGLLVSERFSERRIPALTRYKSVLSAGILDVTNGRSMPWLLNKLKIIQDSYKIDAFYLDFGIAYDMPHYYQCEKPLINPDTFKVKMMTNGLQQNISTLGISSAIERPRVPTFVSLPQFKSNWEGLQHVIPTVLTYGIIGYPFLIPGAVGGDVSIELSNETAGVDDAMLPDKELYMRWLQLATFLPVMRFTHLPSKYSDGKVLELAKTLNNLRQRIVIPLLKKYALESLDSGLPLIRPLWMLDPSDPSCHVVADEFAVGGELIVAPILYPGKMEREVYLPLGVWKDGIDGSLRKGSRWIHDYRVAEDQIGFFMKMPDDTRF